MKTKIVILFTCLAILPLMLMAGIMYQRSSAALARYDKAASETIRKIENNQLESINAAKSAAVSGYFETITHQIRTFAQNKMIVGALSGFKNEFVSYRKDADVSRTQLATMRERVQAYYEGPFSEAYREANQGDAPAVSELMSKLDDDSIALQFSYVAANPNPLGQKDNLDKASDGTSYSRLHGQVHPVIRDYLRRFGYYDIFLVDGASGDIVYSVFKELDFSTSLRDGPYADTNFGDVFEKVNQLEKGDSFALVDFKTYGPSYEAPASFIGAPVFDGDRRLGVAIFQMPLDRISAVMGQRAGHGESGESYLVGADGLLRSDTQNSEAHTVMTAFSDPESSRIATEAVRRALAGESGVVAGENYLGKKVLSAYRPIEIAGLKWAVISEIEESEALAPILALAALPGEASREIILWALGLLVLAVALILLATQRVSRQVTTPMKEVVECVERASEGDLTQVPEIASRDELGRMAAAVRGLLESLAGSLGEMKETGAKVRESAISLSQTAGSMSTDASTMDSSTSNVARTTEEMSSNINTVATAVEESSSNIRNVAAAVEEMSNNLNMVSSNSRVTAEAVDKVAELIEKMNTSLADVAGSSGKAASVAEKATGIAQATSARMGGLGEAADEIGKVVAVINDIAERTDLLALNATIEAASAGEAGRGFAVVANEVKELAKQTARATDEIRAKIEAMQSNTGDAVTAISDIVDIIREIDSLSSQINSSVDHQRHFAHDVEEAVSSAAMSAQEISNNVQEASSGATEVARNAEELARGSNEIARNAAEAARGAAGLSDAIREVSVRVKGTASGASTVDESARNLENAAGEMHALVARFAT